MTSQRWMLTVCLVSALGAGESASTTESVKYTCRTFGSGVVQPFIGSGYHVRSSCPFTLTRFTHNRVECDITTQRGDSGLLVQVEIIINKIKTVLQNGSVLVDKTSVALPYDHTYQHVFQYGIYTKLRSSLLPLSVTWHNVPGGIDTLWVELEQELSTDMTGLCGKYNVSGSKDQLIATSVLPDQTCQTRESASMYSSVCRQLLSQMLECLQSKRLLYLQLCEENIYSYENSKYIGCSFYKELVQQCGNKSSVWNTWRTLTKCVSPSCPGDLIYKEEGPAFVPSCSNPRLTNQDRTSTCVCPTGTVLNDRADAVHCVNVSSCPCVFAGKNYMTGDIRTSKCQSCVCDGGRWLCSENYCPARCLVEGHFVTTFDGKPYVLPGKCTYVVSQGLNWTITIQFAESETSLKTVVLQLFQETFTFSRNRVQVGEEEITELYESENALVFWQSSMYVLVQTSFGMKIQVQMSPEIQLYIIPATQHSERISGLCGNNNNDTTDDFTTSSGIIENSPQTFALSWSLGTCVDIPPICIIRDNEIFAEEKCSVLNNQTGVFAKCHAYLATDHYFTTCVQRTCNCGSNLQQCLCVALGSYAKACSSLGVEIGDWRTATECTVTCQKNQEFSYSVQRCNHTCLSLSRTDPRCGLYDDPVEGCGCPEGTHLNQGGICTRKAECGCYHHGGITPPGHVVMDGRQCSCKNGELHCSKDCGCSNGKVCVHCSESAVNTAQKTCSSLSKPLGIGTTCESGCYCPYNLLEDHHGNCVSLDNCTCMYSGKVFGSGDRVKTGCNTCVCVQGHWHCEDRPCPGKCQVYGNGHYQTFDSKWYRFNGHCQYTLVEDYCRGRSGSFSVRAASVPCCDEALTCSRSIILDLQGKVTLTLSNMKVIRSLPNNRTLEDNSLYTTRTVGLYIVISVPSSGITLIWDKHTRITIELHPKWRNQVCGLCGNFDSNEMNDLQIGDSAVASSPMDFGNSWKAATPPCSDVTSEIFPCERNSYCSAWAQQRCLIITGDIFKDCHLKVNPEPYYQACVQESCSCQFEGKFLGFCTAVAAYAEACSELDVCVRWRTPDLCPVYCDYYNEERECTWHYEACGTMLTCNKDSRSTHKLEGCFPRCPQDAPYYDENTGKCTKLNDCTCYFNDTIVQPGATVTIDSEDCPCENGTIACPPPPPTLTTTATTIPTTTEASSTTEATSTSTEVVSTSTIPTTTTATTEVSSTTEATSTIPTTTEESSTTEATSTIPTTTEESSTTEATSTIPTTTEESSTTEATSTSTTTEESSTTEATSTIPTTTEESSTTEATSTIPTTTEESSTTEVVSTSTIPTTTEESSTTEVVSTSTIPTTTEESSTTEATSTIPTTTEESSTTEVVSTSTIPTTTEESSTTEVVSTSTIPTTTEESSTTEATSTIPTTTEESSTTEVVSTSTIPTTTEESSTTEATSTIPTTTEESSTTEATSTIPTTTEESSTTEVVSTSTIPTTTEESSTTEATSTSTTTEESSTTEATSTSTTTEESSTTEATSTIPTTTEESSTTEATSTIPTTTEESSTTEVVSTSTIPTTTEESSTTEVVSTSTIPTTTEESSTTEATSTIPTTTEESSTTEVVSTSTIPTTTEESSTTEVVSTSTIPTTTEESSTTEATSTIPTTTEESNTEIFTAPQTNGTTLPQTCKECTDLKTNQNWQCGETWTEDCYNKICNAGKIEMTPVVCPEATVPSCPRGLSTEVSDGCCKTYKCDCRCELYGDPHYISFSGVTFDFLDNCTYTLVEEQSPQHNLTIAVDNFYCVPGLPGSCAKSIILQYQGNVATLGIIPDMDVVQATLNNVTINAPYEEHGFRFETTGYGMSIVLPEIRSYVSLTPYYTLVINLAMEHFANNTQGQCGVCGGGSCIRRDGHIESDDCCDKTAYDWVYPDPLKPACDSALMDLPCQAPSPSPSSSPSPSPPCPPNPLCELLNHQVFSECGENVNLELIKKNCECDSLTSNKSACSSLEQAAEQCKRFGVCIDWRSLTNGVCDVSCPPGLVYRECNNKLDDFCYGGVRYPGASLENNTGCFCPSGHFRAGNHSSICVKDCSYCKGPFGEPKMPGEVWQSNCKTCTCNNQTRTEECFSAPPEPAPVCGPSAVLVNTSCCGDQACVEMTCSYKNNTYRVGDKWKDPAQPCLSFSCSREGVQTETNVCPREDCPKEDRVWDDQHCCFTCNQSCAPRMSRFTLHRDNCTAVVLMPACQGQCVSQHRVVFSTDLQVEQRCRCCQPLSSETRLMAVHCTDLSTRFYNYSHITSCECRTCS